MGSGVTTYGNEGGALLYSFTAAAGAGSDSGPVAIQAKTYSKWGFCLTGTGTITGGGVYVFGTYDAATANGTSANPSWFPLPSQSTSAAGDAFIYANPLTTSTSNLSPTGGGPAPVSGTGYVLYVSLPLVAVRAVILGSGPVLTGTLNLVTYVAP